MGGAALYAACGSAIWNDGSNFIVTVVGNGYPARSLKKVCKKLKINKSLTKKKNISCIKLDIPYTEDLEHEFILRKNSGCYDDLCPDISLVRKISEKSSVHIATMPLFRQLQYVFSIKEAKYITLDPNIDDIRLEYTDIWRILLRNIDYLLISKIEFERFASVFYTDEKIGDQLIIKFMNDFCVKNLVLKMGRDGAKLFTFEKKIYHICSVADNVVEVTGAGDSFAGGFLYALNKYSDPVLALKFATISSKQIIENVGVKELQYVDHNSIEKLSIDIIGGDSNEQANIYIDKTV